MALVWLLVRSEVIKEESICLSFDIDWAPEEVIQYLVNKLRAAGVKATFFATHRSAVLDKITDSSFEIALHPNFLKVENKDYAAPLKELKKIYPQAKGARSHGLFFSSQILALYQEHGLVYEANIFLYQHENLHPVPRYADLLSIPTYWSEDKHIEMHEKFTIEHLGVDAPGLKVYNFHPIHVFMNTPSLAYYESFRDYYQDVEELKRCKYIDGDGIETLLDVFLEHLTNNAIPTFTLGEIYDHYK